MTMNMRPLAPQEPEELDAPRPSGGSGRWVVLLALVIGGLLTARQYMGPSHAMADWKSDWEAGLQQAETTGKPMLVLFTADWCGPCQELKKDVLSDAQVAGRLRNEFTLVKVDLTEQGGPNGQTAATYGVRGIPTLIRFNAKGEQVDRLSGGVPKDVLLRWLDGRATLKRKRPS